jgi:hypothetical protein
MFKGVILSDQGAKNPRHGVGLTHRGRILLKSPERRGME